MKTETKDKLELRHLAPYLPYGLKALWNDKILTINGLTLHYPIYEEPVWRGIVNYATIKPILRPLSDLESPNYVDEIDCAEYIINKELSSDLDYETWQWLFENHFDVFGLIEKGLAIDINTIK